MNLDDRLDRTRAWLDTTTASLRPDLDDLDRRQRRRHHRVAVVSTIVVGVLLGGVGLYVVNRDDAKTIAAGATAQPEPAQPDVDPTPADGPAFVLPAPPDGWEETTPLTTGIDHASSLAGEEFSQVYVRFGAEQDAFSAHEGDLTGSIRVAVGTYDTGLRELFAGPASPVTIGGRDFELIETTSEGGTAEVALVPVDISERAFLVVARGVDADVVVAMAEPIDPTRSIPRIGSAPDGFTVIYSGPPEFSVLDAGTSITYRAPSGGQTFTVTTYRGSAISCFANAWAYSDTEIARIGGDAGVIAQLDGPSTAVGTYRALWNHSHDTLIGVTATGIDRATLIDLAGQLVVDDGAIGYQAHLELIA